MTELKGIKIEDLNVTKSTFIKLIGLLDLDLELPDDEHICFDESFKNFKSGMYMASYYNLQVYGDKHYSFTLSFFFSKVTGNDFTFTMGWGGNCNTFDLSVDYLFKSEILKPVNEVSTEMIEAKPEQPEEDAEEPEEEKCFSYECSDHTNGKIKLTLGTGKNAIIKYYSSLDEMYEDNPDYREEFFKFFSIDSKLTPLERTVFEAREKCFNRYHEYVELAYKSLYMEVGQEAVVRYHQLANEQIFNADFLADIIRDSGLEEKYQSWLAERKEQEAVGASK